MFQWIFSMNFTIIPIFIAYAYLYFHDFKSMIGGIH
jgi:hypothetical protein